MDALNIFLHMAPLALVIIQLGDNPGLHKLYIIINSSNTKMLLDSANMMSELYLLLELHCMLNVHLVQETNTNTHTKTKHTADGRPLLLLVLGTK